MSVDFLAGGGEAGALLRAMAWDESPLGPREGWPQSLRTAVSILLNSRYPMFTFWGPEAVQLYNDSYAPILGAKHPWAMGRPGREIWAEIWDTIGPMVDRVVQHGEATFSDDLLLVMERRGFPEETYFTFSYSPIRDESGGIGGLFCACTETTEKVIGERRLRTLRDLAASPLEARNVDDACRRSADVLGQNLADLPFSLLYLDTPDEGLRLAAWSGAEPGRPYSPRGDREARAAWPLDEAMRELQPVVVEGLAERLPEVPAGPWPEPPSSATLLPLVSRGSERPAGVVVLGASARLAADEPYRDFLALVARQLASSISTARAAEEERRRAEALAELDRAKTTFFSNVSHELRTPLTLMLSPTEDLLARDLPADDRAMLEVIHRNGQRLLKLVNTLLDFSRIEAGRVQARFEPTPIARLTAELASVFRAAIEKAGLTFDVRCPPLREPIYVDRDMWEKIVLNLLSNAFKFTFEGSITVTLDEEDEHAVLRVRDTGTGIADDDLPALFQRFHRVEGARGRTHEGSGIGLALVHELVKLHHGHVTVESEVDRGSTFTVRIPKGHAHLPAGQVEERGERVSTALGAAPFVEEALRWLPEPPTQPERTLDEPTLPSRVGPDEQRACVLVADDNADMREYLARLLAPFHDVVTVADGEAALERALALEPDLVLSDVMMPKLDGLGLLRRLREVPRLASTPVLLLSARAGEEARVEGLEAGADDYLVKPFSARELVARVSGSLALARARREKVEAIAEADRRKDDFLATLAHELRNPLAPIRSGLEILEMAVADDAALTRPLAIMQRQLAQLVRLVDDLLDVSRIGRGKIELRRARFDLRVAFDSALEATRETIARAGHALTVERAEEPVWVDGDEARLAQVIANLLTNAATYTDPGGHVTARLAALGDDAVVQVQDDGLGLAPEQVEHAFEMFGQVHGPERSMCGLGIGLALVRSLVDLHGGAVEVESEGLGHGSTFTVRVPRSAPPEDAADAPRREAPTGLAVLVVDDNADAALSLSMLLERMRCGTHVAHGGAEAVAAAEARMPDLILMDLGMPEVDGFEACRRIRALPGGDRPHVVALTGWARAQLSRDPLEHGFDGHVVKPMNRRKLEALLRDVEIP